MQRLIHFLRGSVRVEIEGAFPERFINICAQNGIEFWDLERLSGHALRVTMYMRGYRRLGGLLENAMCTAKNVKEGGAPFFLWGLRHRYMLFLGMLACLGFLWWSTMYVWEIDIEGNRTISDGEILKGLENAGVRLGAYGLAISSEDVRNRMLAGVKELAWVTVNVRGSRAEVLVRERVPKPEIVDEKTPADVITLKTGIIEKLEAYNGTAAFNVGDTVLQGETVVSGAVPSKSTGTRFVRALGDVYLHTWYEFSARMPLEITKKRYTGEKITKSTLIILGKHIKLYFSSGIPQGSYDKITTESKLKLPGGIVLPASLSTVDYLPYEGSDASLDETSARKLLQKCLRERLLDRLAEEYEICNISYTSSVENRVITVTLLADCIEQTAGTRIISAAEIARIKAQEESAKE